MTYPRFLKKNSVLISRYDQSLDNHSFIITSYNHYILQSLHESFLYSVMFMLLYDVINKHFKYL